MRLPARLPELLRRRAEWLERDLLLAPQRPVLLAAAAEAALGLSRVHQPSNPALAEHWRAEARRYADRLRAVNPELYPLFRQAIEDPGVTTWAPPGYGNLVGISAQTHGDRAYRVLVETERGPVMASAVAQVSPLSGRSAGRAIAPPPPELPGYPRMGNFPAGSMGFGSSSIPTGPVLTFPNTPSSAAVYALGAPLAELKGLAEAQPHSASAASQYAQALEARAEIEVRDLPADQRKEALRSRLLEAGRMYEQAARNARLRTYRAAFLCAAADAYGRARADELQYAALRRAVQEAPISAPIWRDLQGACLRTDRIRESDEAWRAAQQWSLPVLRINY
jgi:hypothetical protein